MEESNIHFLMQIRPPHFTNPLPHPFRAILPCEGFLLCAVGESHASFLAIEAGPSTDGTEARSGTHTSTSNATCYTGIRLEASLAVAAEIV
jgi:hypothetical protein